MKIFLTAAAAGLGLGLAACAQPDPAKPTLDEALANEFANALNYECGGGKSLDLVYGVEGMQALKIRFDGGAPQALAIDPDAQDGITYKGGDVTLLMDGADVAYTAAGATTECKFMIKSLPAPTVEGVAHALTELDAGKSFEIKVGQKISVALVGVPTAGYVWAASSPPDWVKASDGPGGATSTAQMLPGFAGGNHWEVIIIEAVAAGEGEIVLAQRRPWEDAAEPAADTFTFTLKAS